MEQIKIATKEKIKYLKWWDIVIIALIMFGTAIYGSTISYFELTQGIISENEALTFSSFDNWSSIIAEILTLIVVFIYLKIRRFDFSVWKFKISFKVVLQSILIFLAIALVFDIYYGVFLDGFDLTYTGQFNNIKNLISQMDISLILFSFLNGFFEEIFFLGICLSVKQDKIKWILIFSLIIRFSFHTYQGMISSLGIGIILGLIYYFLYEKVFKRNLVPFILSHSLADIFGLGIIYFILK